MVDIGWLALGLTTLTLRKRLVLLPLVGRHLWFPIASIRMTIGLLQVWVCPRVRLILAMLRLLIGLTHPKFRLLNSFRGVMMLPSFPPILRSALHTGMLSMGACRSTCPF